MPAASGYASVRGMGMQTQCIRACACALAAIASLCATPARAADPPAESRVTETAWVVLAYLPNRLFDLCDIVRLHVRVGDGVAVGARATRFLPVFIGDYSVFWVGLPGPRGRASMPLPMGMEAQKGLDAGPVSASSKNRAPQYGVGEIGAGGMAMFVGVDAGVDPYELADFLAGFVLVDFAHDDF